MTSKLTRAIGRKLLGWRDIAHIEGGNGRSTHTLSTDGTVVTCTCQSYRIHKHKTCKHVQAYEQGLLFTNPRWLNIYGVVTKL